MKSRDLRRAILDILAARNDGPGEGLSRGEIRGLLTRRGVVHTDRQVADTLARLATDWPRSGRHITASAVGGMDVWRITDFGRQRAAR